MSFKVKLTGIFSVTAPDGSDLTPKGAKEKALLALLAFAPEHARSRQWLKSKLWSDRFETQANTSLRRALSNIRKSLGEHAISFASDHTKIWLEPDVELDLEQSGVSLALEDVDVCDPEFEDWLRDIRLRLDEPPVPSPASPAISPSKYRTIALIVGPTDSAEGSFLQRLFSEILAETVVQHGSVEVLVDDVPSKNTQHDRIEINGYVSGNNWILHARILEYPRGRHIWSGRSRHSLDQVKNDTVEQAFAAFANDLLNALCERKLAIAPDAHPFFKLSYAINRLFTGRTQDLDIAEGVLSELVHTTNEAVPLAWLGFAKLTQTLEHPNTSHECSEQALEAVSTAVAKSGGNSVVLALAAKAHLWLLKDVEYCNHLARKALRACETDPYAAFAASLGNFYNGETDKGMLLIDWARGNAQKLGNSFFWDAQAAITGLASYDFRKCYDDALRCYAKMPTYRPGLRYLTAISLLLNEEEDAKRFSDRLQLLEPEFSFDNLWDENYPMASLRKLGLSDLARQNAGKLGLIS